MVQSNRVTCPYNDYPDEAYWHKWVTGGAVETLDGSTRPRFKIDQSTKIATAGSCFAQHISRYLTNCSYTYFVTENFPAELSPEYLRLRYNYGVFTARFGNIYTVRQLLQLFERAYSEFMPEEEFWRDGDRYLDPYRPLIQPIGFESLEALREDRTQHLASVRRMFEEVDVFVFTLGLTEAWVSKSDGAVFPVCPGCGVGTFDPSRYVFRNFRYSEILADMKRFLELLRLVNPDVRVILTVSPVPLVATATGQHVLVATTYSKSALRAVAGDVSADITWVEYFPSYELITTSANRGRFFSADARTVTEQGVRAVMTAFFLRFANQPVQIPEFRSLPNRPHEIRIADAKDENMAVVAGLICEEEMLRTLLP